VRTVEAIFDLLRERGGLSYGEDVTVLEHSLQAALFAKDEGGDGFVIACLLHDVGHLVHDGGERIADRGIDARHEAIGARVLSAILPDAVVEPIRRHVDAKRYLCATEPSYFAELSTASMQSLALQGGPMTATECADFERNPFHRDAVRLRRIDERAKIVGMKTPGLDEYLPLARTLVAPV
jgi:[1-hydroxy-2-(trimethylamino)ethyl]phosphonate dioxygenase